MRHSFANGLERKHAVKQVDRWLTHTKLNVWSLFDDRVPYVVAERTEIVVSMDWTEFDTDDHSTLVISLQTSHGRSTSLLWKTHQKSRLKGQRNAHEKARLTPTGRTRMLKEVELTSQRQRGERAYCCQKSDMKEPWFLASNRVDLNTTKALRLYGQCWGIETRFRDIKDDKLGMEMG